MLIYVRSVVTYEMRLEGENISKRTGQGGGDEEYSTVSFVTLIIVLIIVGVALWCINAYIPMDHKIKMVLNIAVVVVVVIWLLKSLGVFSELDSVRIN